MVDRTKELGMSAIALTDHGTLSGVIEFYNQCRQKEIKPIIGVEAYLTPKDRQHTDRISGIDNRRSHLIILAATNQGYHNLLRLVTIAHLDGLYHKPRIDRQLLKEYNQGLIVLSGCLGGELARAIESDRLEDATETAQWFKSVFGDRYYLELQDNLGYPPQEKVNQGLIKLAKKLQIPPVVTTDNHYLLKEDKPVHEILLCVQTGSFLSDKKRLTMEDLDLHLADPKDIVDRWQSICPEALVNTKKIADRCQVEIDFQSNLLPHFEVPPKKTTNQYLEELIYQGLKRRYLNRTSSAADTKAAIRPKLPQAVRQRVDIELKTIFEMDFAAYFLIVWDLCRYGKEQGIFFGPARGSAAGSIVSYSLDITQVDPLANSLLFERFLNPDRISLPDIDIDIEDQRRDEIIDYVVDKYGGQRQVAAIITFGRMAARNSVRDVARVMKMPYKEADNLAKMIPPRSANLAAAFVDNPKLGQQRQANQDYDRLFRFASRLEGTIRNHGVHAAGLVIAPAGRELVEFTPLEISPKGAVATQYSMYPIESLGLLKLDLLGLTNLTTIKNALRIIRKVYQKDIDLANLELDDTKTYQLLSRADTVGIFQVESSGMRDCLLKLQPNQFNDIVALLALYRPGPIQAGIVDMYINRKHGREAVDYPHPSFEAALKDTYGLPVYQEQVMQVSRDVCGFTGGQPDTLRKAIGKKIRSQMLKLKPAFIEGGVKHSQIDRPIMEKFWQDLVGFAEYAFNRSHSVSYGLVCYQTAYLKANWRIAFMAALMTSETNDIDKLKIEIDECVKHSIEVLPPDINDSYHEFAVVASTSPTPDKGQIRFGLDAIKKVGHKAVAVMLDDRQANGPFAGLDDFIARVGHTKAFTRATLESLIKTGAFDFDGSFNTRQAILQRLDELFSLNGQLSASSVKQTSFFGQATIQSAITKPSASKTKTNQDQLNQILAWERELLGVYLSGHPLDNYSNYGRDKKLKLQSIAEVKDQIATIDDHADEVQPPTSLDFQVLALVSQIRQLWTKKKQAMAFVTLEDQTDSLELPFFPMLWQKYQTDLIIDRPIRVDLVWRWVDGQGRRLSRPDWRINQVINLESDDNQTQLMEPKDSPQPTANHLWLRIKSNSNSAQDCLYQIKQALAACPGGSQVFVVFGQGNQKSFRKVPKIRVNYSPELEASLKAIDDIEAIKFEPSKN